MLTETREQQVNRICEHGARRLSRETLAREIERAEDRGAEQALASQYLTIRQAAKYLRCSRESVYVHIRNGRLPFVNSVSGRRLIPMQALVELRDQRLEPTMVRLSPTMVNLLVHSRQPEGFTRVLLANSGNINRRTLRALMRRGLIEFDNPNRHWCLTEFGVAVRATLPEVAS